MGPDMICTRFELLIYSMLAMTSLLVGVMTLMGMRNPQSKDLRVDNAIDLGVAVSVTTAGLSVMVGAFYFLAGWDMLNPGWMAWALLVAPPFLFPWAVVAWRDTPKVVGQICMVCNGLVANHGFSPTCGFYQDADLDDTPCSPETMCEDDIDGDLDGMVDCDDVK